MNFWFEVPGFKVAITLVSENLANDGRIPFAIRVMVMGRTVIGTSLFLSRELLLMVRPIWGSAE